MEHDAVEGCLWDSLWRYHSRIASIAADFRHLLSHASDVAEGCVAFVLLLYACVDYGREAYHERYTTILFVVA